jgi:hypothetical protein
MPAQESGADAENFYYSFNYGPAHVIALDSERGDFSHQLRQYTWLESELQSVDRSVTPWVLVTFHRPWYCSNTAHPGSGDAMRDSYEDLFYKYGVDVNLVGHTHAYERTKPMYKVCDSVLPHHLLSQFRLPFLHFSSSFLLSPSSFPLLLSRPPSSPSPFISNS